MVYADWSSMTVPRAGGVLMRFSACKDRPAACGMGHWSHLSVDDLARWLTAINRICPIDGKSRRPIRDGDMRL